MPGLYRRPPQPTQRRRPPAWLVVSDFETECLADSPVFSAPIDEPSGNWIDIVAAKTVTVYGTPTYGVTPSGVAGHTAVDLNASGDYGDTPDHADLDLGGGNFSLEVVAALDSTPTGWHVLFAKLAAGGNFAYGIAVNASGNLCLTKPGLAAMAISTYLPPADGTFHHIVWTVPASPASTGDYKLRVDGVARTLSYEDYSTAFQDTTGVFTIGRESSGEPWPGKLQYVNLYKSVLSPARIDIHNAARSVAPGGTPVVRTVTDALGLSDAVARVGVFLRSTTESLAASDAATRSGALLRSTTESVTAAGVVTRLSSAIRAAADSVSQADAVARAGTFLRAATEAVGQSQATVRVGTFIRPAAESLTHSESATGVKLVIRSVVDSVAHGEAAARTVSLLRTTVAAVTSSDAVTRVGSFARAVADAVGTSEVAEAIKTGGIVARTAVDAVTSSEAATRTGAFLRSAAESLAAADVPSRTGTALRSVVDAIAHGETATRVLAAARSATDAATHADAATRSGAFVRTAVDGVASSDVATTVQSMAGGLVRAVATPARMGAGLAMRSARSMASTLARMTGGSSTHEG